MFGSNCSKKDCILYHENTPKKRNLSPSVGYRASPSKHRKIKDERTPNSFLREDKQYKFVHDSISNPIHHEDMLSPSNDDILTFLYSCRKEHLDENGKSLKSKCSYVKVKDHFNEVGYVPWKSLLKDPKKFNCNLCDFTTFYEEKYYDHLCLQHFKKDLEDYLKHKNKCPCCLGDIKLFSNKEKILHYGSGSVSHRKVVHLLAEKIKRASEDKVKAFSKQVEEMENDFNVQFEEKLKQNLAITKGRHQKK